MSDYYTQHKNDLKKFYQLYIKSSNPAIKSRATNNIASLVPAEELKKWG